MSYHDPLVLGNIWKEPSKQGGEYYGERLTQEQTLYSLTFMRWITRAHHKYVTAAQCIVPVYKIDLKEGILLKVRSTEISKGFYAVRISLYKHKLHPGSIFSCILDPYVSDMIYVFK